VGCKLWEFDGQMIYGIKKRNNLDYFDLSADAKYFSLQIGGSGRY
jgi:hypothetical protein